MTRRHYLFLQWGRTKTRKYCKQKDKLYTVGLFINKGKLPVKRFNVKLGIHPLGRGTHGRRTHDRRRKTAVFLTAGHLAKYVFSDKSPQTNFEIRFTFIYFPIQDLVHTITKTLVIQDIVHTITQTLGQ